MSDNQLDFILLIPCYNNINGLIKSIHSVHYSSNKFELLIIDDGSTTPISSEELRNLFANININIIRIEKNRGILNALNTGLKTLSTRNDYKYIARLDAGDTCQKERFTKQVHFLNTHTDTFLVGTWCTFKNSETNKTYNYTTKTEHESILKEMHFKCSFIHPTVIFRKEVIKEIGLYPNYPLTEDYAFFWQIAQQHKTAIIPELLVTIEYSQQSISSIHYIEQLKNRKKIVKAFGNSFVLKCISLLFLNVKIILPKRLVLFLKNSLN